MEQKIASSHLRPKGYSLDIQEYEPGTQDACLLFRGYAANLSFGFDLTADEALKFAAAITKHANALKSAEARTLSSDIELLMSATSEAAVDAELLRLGIDPDDAARRGQQAVSNALAAMRSSRGVA